MFFSRRAPALLALLVLCLPAPVRAQVLTEYGDPVLAVTDPAKAVATGATKAKAPPLTTGQRVHLLEVKEGQGLVSVPAPDPQVGMSSDFLYRVPMAAVTYLPGKTHLDRPAWLSAPAPAATVNRDVVAFEKGGSIVVSAGGNTKAVAKGTAPAVSPDGTRLAYTPDKGAGLVLVPLGGEGKPTRLGSGKEPVRQKAFCPDGSKLAWFVDGQVLVLDLARPQAKPATVASALERFASLQGFTKECDAVVIHNGDTVQWLGLDGKRLRSLPVGSFTNAEEGSSSDAYIPSPAEANLLLLVGTTAGTDTFHRWASDSSGALYIYDMASGTNYRLTPRNLAVASAAWSPDGKRIYFSALPDTPPNGPHRLYRVNADGTGLTDLGPGFAPSVGMRSQ
ncbi:MAG: TolB family protein [Solidesulfovibrio sp. DCME]|uniref:TolB family protein n=1 Tax=Solidesulfovibrio sp. DCME TaxID=3447380 RepID=UPI003D13A7E2